MANSWKKFSCSVLILSCFLWRKLLADSGFELRSSTYRPQNISHIAKANHDELCVFNMLERVTWHYGQEQAILLVAVKLLPLFCNLGQIELQLSTNTCDSSFYKIHTPKRRLNLNTNDLPRPHIKVNACNPNLVIPDIASRLLKVSEEQANFRLRHVYSSIYCLRIFVFRKGFRKYEEYKQDLQLISKEEVVYPFDWNTTIDAIHMPLRTLRIRFPLPDVKYEFSQFLVTLLLINGSCPTTQFGWINLPVRKATCLKPFSKDAGVFIESHFRNLDEGNYCVLITPMDERCHPTATYWQESPDLSCTRYYPRTVSIDNSSWLSVEAVDPVCCSPEDLRVIAVGTFFASCTAIAALLLLARFRKLKSFRGKGESEAKSTPDHVTISVRQRQSQFAHLAFVPVVLLYEVGEKSVHKKIQQLKQVLTSIGFCQVYDYRDDAMYDLLATYGPTWITALLARPETKVVVVTSAGAVEAEHELLGIETNARNTREVADDPLEHVYLQGLKEVMILGQKKGGGYQRIFSVRFPEITGSDIALSFITPFVCFLLPEHTPQLLNHIHGLTEDESALNGFWGPESSEWQKFL